MRRSERGALRPPVAVPPAGGLLVGGRRRLGRPEGLGSGIRAGLSRTPDDLCDLSVEIVLVLFIGVVLRAILDRPVLGADALLLRRALGPAATVGLGRAGVDPPRLGHRTGDLLVGSHRGIPRALGHLREEIDEPAAQRLQIIALSAGEGLGEHAADAAGIRLRHSAEAVDRVGIPGLAAGDATTEEGGVMELQRRWSFSFGGRSSAQRSE